jgi:hypothetical protein
MNLHITRRRLCLASCVALSCGWGSGAYSQDSTQGLPKNLESVVKQFAGSGILGTGARQFVTSIRVVDASNAVAIVGEASSEGRDPNAYTVHAKTVGKKWKIVSYEFVFRPSGEKISKNQIPPFPYSNWQKDLP